MNDRFKPIEVLIKYLIIDDLELTAIEVMAFYKRQ